MSLPGNHQSGFVGTEELWHTIYMMYTNLFHYIPKPVGKVLFDMYMRNL